MPGTALAVGMFRLPSSEIQMDRSLTNIPTIGFENASTRQVIWHTRFKFNDRFTYMDVGTEEENLQIFRPNGWLITAATIVPLDRKVHSFENRFSITDGGMLKAFALRFPLRKADGVVFQPNHAQQYFDKSITEHSKIILNPIKNDIYDIFYEGERKNIVTAGRLTSMKNQLMLIDAFSRISNLTDDNLLIYGQGNYYDILKNRINELKMDNRIFLMGNSDKLHEEIKSAKMFVLSSDLEGLPNALMEAMALGLPCISTDCQGGGARMVIENDENGFLVPVGDVDALAEKIKYLLSLSQEERDKIGKNARKSAENFKADVVCQKWESYIKELMEG
jgi:glycosyltransferase involved in cell wall biosynthesis